MSNLTDKTAKLIFAGIAAFAIGVTLKDCRFDVPPLQPVVTKKIPASSGSLLAKAELSPLVATAA